MKSFALNIKALTADGAFEGYASVFGVRDQGGDIVEPGAFAKTLRARGARGIKMLADHDPTKRVGVWDELREDATGLFARGHLLIDKQIGAEALIDLKAGALDGLSIGYRVIDAGHDGPRRARVLKELDLLEVSLVPFPMNESARVTAVKAADEIGTRREFEAFLRKSGFSQSRAKAIAAGGFHDQTDQTDTTELHALLRRNIAALR